MCVWFNLAVIFTIFNPILHLEEDQEPPLNQFTVEEQHNQELLDEQLQAQLLEQQEYEYQQLLQQQEYDQLLQQQQQQEQLVEEIEYVPEETQEQHSHIQYSHEHHNHGQHSHGDDHHDHRYGEQGHKLLEEEKERLEQIFTDEQVSMILKILVYTQTQNCKNMSLKIYCCIF